MAVLRTNSGSTAKKRNIPNNLGPMDLTDMVFSTLSETVVIINVVTVRVSDLPIINANSYDLALHFINGAWQIVQNAINFNIGGWDGLTWTITTTGQVQFTSDNMLGVYNVAQSNVTYKVALKS